MELRSLRFYWQEEILPHTFSVPLNEPFILENKQRGMKNESMKTVLLTDPLWGHSIERWVRNLEEGGGDTLVSQGVRGLRSIYSSKSFRVGPLQSGRITGHQKRPAETPPAVLLLALQPFPLLTVSMIVPFTPREHVSSMGLCVSGYGE